MHGANFPEKKRFLNEAIAEKINPLIPVSDEDRISSYNISTISTRIVMRKKKNINLRIIGWSNTKFSELTL